MDEKPVYEILSVVEEGVFVRPNGCVPLKEYQWEEK